MNLFVISSTSRVKGLPLMGLAKLPANRTRAPPGVRTPVHTDAEEHGL